MRKRIVSMLGAALLAAGVLGAPSPASAEPRYLILECYEIRGTITTIPLSQYYSCPQGLLKFFDSYTGRNVHTRAGDCANNYWSIDHSRTYQYALDHCKALPIT
ncbi:hypothetical protein [Catellatospora methionotrophica]|uniref:hypothetical protein n=1 Tax=Catellatospora methionotrophica TaxID=121620 RepID=UPI0033C53F0B